MLSLSTFVTRLSWLAKSGLFARRQKISGCVRVRGGPREDSNLQPDRYERKIGATIPRWSDRAASLGFRWLNNSPRHDPHHLPNHYIFLLIETGGPVL
jgi:hypothetical protein